MIAPANHKVDQEIARRRQALAKAARSLFEAARIAVDEADEHCWRVGNPGAGFLFWPGSGLWRHPNGSAGGGGPLGLIRAIRDAPPSPGSEIGLDPPSDVA